MNTRRKKIEAIAIAAIMVVSVFGAIAPMANATVSNLAWTDDDDYVVFCNETVTFTWVDDTNTTNNWGLSNVTNGAHLIHYGSVAGTYNPTTGNYEFVYSLTDYTGIYGDPDNATATLVFAVNGTGNAVADTSLAQLTKQFAMNNYSINLLARNLLAGTVKDDIFIKVNTSGASANSTRANAFTVGEITTNSTGTTFTLSMSTTTGNGTVDAIIGNDPGYYYVNVATGSVERVDYFNVTNITAETTKVRAAVNGNNQSLCYLNLTGGNATVDSPVLVNISIDTSLRPDDKLLDNTTGTGATTINVTLLANHCNWTQDATSNPYGNYTNPINISTTGSAAGAGRLIIDTNVTGGTNGKKWYAPYEVVSATTNITGEVSPSWARVGDNISISSWTTNTTIANIWANISYYNGSAMVYVENIAITPDDTYGTNTKTWDTNATWQNWFAYNRTFDNNPENFTVNVTDALGNNTLQYVELYDYMVPSTDVTDYAAINTSFNITVNSSMRNVMGINLTMTALNATGGTVTINNSAFEIITNYDTTTHNSSVVILYNTSYGTDYANLTDTVGSFWGTNGVGEKILTIKANDTAWSDTTTVTLKDEIIIDSYTLTVVPGQNATIKGRVLRHDGTVINCTESGTNYDHTDDTITTGYNATTGYSNFTVNWTTTVSGTVGGTPLQEGAYTLYFNDTFVKTSAIQITLGAGEISYTVSPDPAGIDDIVWFNGTTNLGTGTIINAEITKDSTVITNNTWNANLTTTVADGGFSLWWLPRNNATNISSVFTPPETTFQVNVSNATNNVCLTTSFNLSDMLTVDDVAIAAGDQFNVTGTTTRADGIQIIVNVTGFNVDHGATPAAWNGQYNQSFNATTDNKAGGTAISTGAYTITANDTIITTATGTLTVETPRIEMVSPSDGVEIEVETNVSVTGSTNRGDGTTATVTITGPNYAPGGVGTTIQSGAFTYYWNTSDLATGTYYITAQTTMPDNLVYTDMISVKLIKSADLIVEGIEPKCGYLFGNESNNITATVKNNGIGAAGAFNVSFAADGFSDEVSVSGLAAGANITVYAIDTTSRNAGATVTITVTADCDGVISESNETNNVMSETFTVYNNGYKNKSFMGMDSLELFHDAAMYGGIVYNVSGTKNYPFDTAETETRIHHIDIPAGMTVKKARLYVYWYDYWSNPSPGYMANLGVNFSGTTFTTPDAAYTDQKGFGTYNTPKGTYAYNVTSQVTGTGDYTVIVENIDPNNKTTLLGEMLFVVYEDPTQNTGNRIQLWILEGNDLLMAADDTHGNYNYAVSPEEATATVVFPGSIDVTAVSSATLVSVVAQGMASGSNMLFNGEVIKTDAWDSPTEAYSGSKINVESVNVTAKLTASGNNMGFLDNGTNGMQASNAILVVTTIGLPKTGDMDGSGGDLNMQDVILLARNVMLGATDYPLSADGDVDSSGGDLNMQDVILLARNVMLGATDYPLYP